LGAATKLTTESKDQRVSGNVKVIVGRYCPKKYTEFGPCVNEVEYRNRTWTAQVDSTYLEFSAKCLEADDEYRNYISKISDENLRAASEWGSSVRKWISRSDEESAASKTHLTAQVDSVLTDKIYVNISGEKIDSCRAEINKAIKDNLRNSCYSNLIHKDWTASILESSSKLHRLAGELNNTSAYTKEAAKNIRQTLSGKAAQ
jgi:hypothetical protein